ncbi:uncharacterized protein TNCV_4801491 [Trichonephila clavipes]|nr:uncharacterized protein TNCV_4801491 [Trichonephila clavipes]
MVVDLRCDSIKNVICNNLLLIKRNNTLKVKVSAVTTVSFIIGNVEVNWGCGSPIVKVSDHGTHVMSSSPLPLNQYPRHVGQRCTLNLSRAETSSRWCGVVVRRGGAISGVVHVT